MSVAKYNVQNTKYNYILVLFIPSKTEPNYHVLFSKILCELGLSLSVYKPDASMTYDFRPAIINCSVENERSD